MAGHGSWYDENNFIIWGRQKQHKKNKQNRQFYIKKHYKID